MFSWTPVGASNNRGCSARAGYNAKWSWFSGDGENHDHFRCGHETATGEAAARPEGISR